MQHAFAEIKPQPPEIKLSDQQLTQCLSKHSNWQLDNNRLYRQCTFPGFAAAFGFMAQVAVITEKQDHHPDWSNSYRSVDIWLTTHQFDGISERDFLLADAIDEIVDGKQDLSFLIQPPKQCAQRPEFLRHFQPG